MSTATVLPDLALGIVANLAQTLDVGPLEEWSEDDFPRLTSFSREVRLLVQEARRSVERSLSQGVDGGAFVTRYDPLAAGLEEHSVRLARLVEGARARPVPVPAEGFLTELEALGRDLADLQRLLAEALAKAKAPRRPIDWERVREAEAAYARGETKPFQKLPPARDGS